TYGTSSKPSKPSSSESTSTSSSGTSPHTAETPHSADQNKEILRDDQRTNQNDDDPKSEPIPIPICDRYEIATPAASILVEYLVATFTCLDDMHTALQIPIVFGNEESPNSVIFQRLEDIKPPLSEDTQNDIKRRTLQVIDILLNLKAASVHARFKRYDEITCLTMRTRGLFQHAYIEYSSPDGLAHFYTTSWSDTLGHDIVRVLPLALPQEKREKRQLYCFKLAGLPPNTQSVDIVKYIASISGKTCFIPRNPSNYKLLNYAYINFESEEIQANAALTEHSYKGH
ncbi:hypothetical protein C1645_841109, partial [Glomus cerebriforme]